MGLGNQICLLMWKNWLLQKRKICVSIFEVLLPVAFAVILLIIRLLVKTENVKPTYYNRQLISDVPSFRYGSIIGFTPNVNGTIELMNSVLDLINDDPRQNTINITVKPFTTEDEAVAFFKANSDQMSTILVFNGVTNNNGVLPRDLVFTVRPQTGNDKWRTDITYPFFQNGNPNSDVTLYKNHWVLYIQSLVGQAVTKYWLSQQNRAPKTVSLQAYIQRMAYPEYFKDGMIIVIQSVLPLFLVLSFILSVIINTKNLIYEKERKLKESMKLMGLTAAAHWISWLFTFSIYLLPAMAIYSLILGIKFVSAGPVLANTDPSLFFVFLLCYALAIITYSFMVSAFIQKANVGAIVSGILFIAFFFPYFFIQSSYDSMSKGSKIGGSLLFNSAMGLGALTLGIYEGTGEGAQWNNFHKPGIIDDNLSLLECMIMMLFDSVVHFLITWYMDNIRPGEFGVPKPFYFCFTKSYWCGVSASWDGDNHNEVLQSKYYEKEPTNRENGIRICNLKKKFGKKVAVAGTSLNMYQGQITVLLGHNGAGKTTTMSMLTGFIPPTSGTAHVNGYDIRDNIAGVRSSLGLCPQHDILFDTLTVEEHLQFFAKLKGLSGPSVKTAAIEMAKEVGLETKFKAKSMGLSGGQKRKLSVGIALIGGSKVVILDEPSSGMDPGARRQMWGVLQRARHDRTLVLSTHYMDEADLLGDRIAIMADGVVKCCGSSMFLKKLYGAGYHLVIVKNNNCDVNKLTHTIQSFVSTAEFESIINTEVSYLLPDNESSKFPDLFRELENNKEQHGIISFGTSATTMEEVFLKVGETVSNEEDTTPEQTRRNFIISENGFTNSAYDNEKNHIYDSENSNLHGVFGNTNKVDAEKRNLEDEIIGEPNQDIMAFNKGFSKKTGLSLEMSRIRGLFVKKAIHTWRNRTVTIVQLLLPVIFTVVGLAIDEARPKQTQAPALTFDLKPFGRTNILYTEGLNETSSNREFFGLYGEQFTNTQNLKNFSLNNGETFDNYSLTCVSEHSVRCTPTIGTSTFNKKFIIGMEVVAAEPPATIAATAYYNGQPLHSQPISVNYLMNTFLRHSLNESYSLQSRIHPLPQDGSATAKNDLLQNLTSGFMIGFFISFGMAFLTTLFMFFLIKERQVGAKHMQVVSGVGPVTYWLPTFLWDFINYIIPSLLLLIVFAAYGKTAYLDDGRWGIVILLLIIYGWAVLPFMYVVQFAFKTPPTGVVVVIMINIISGLITTIAVYILQIPALNLTEVASGLDWFFMVIFPNYNMASCFINIYTNYANLQLCGSATCPGILQFCCQDTCGDVCFKFERDYLSWNKPGIGAYLFFMALQGAIFFLMVLLIEFHFFQRIWYLIRGAPNSGSEMAGLNNTAHQAEDSDVTAERQRINSNPASVLSSTDSLLLVNLYKRYNHFIAVDHICLGVPEQECFGLLGQNGAGKTTTFKMLTGDVMVNGGNAYLKGFDVRSDIKQVQSNMGYCPQFDALIDQMTGRETLTMYARLRGVPEININMVVNALIDILMLRPHADKLAGHYSGGNKRKLSTAIALVGDPPFIMLDEPSSGMDPKARRQLWNVLSQVRASGRTLVLTSHSMEECDALCTRIAIMVNGRFMCLGSPQHLKSKFGQGYTLITQLGVLPDSTTAPNQPVVDFIVSHFPGTKVFDDHQGYVHFQVPDSTVKLADVFSVMEAAKKHVNVEDYSVHQTTLEQVFLTFTRSQIMPKEATSNGCKFPRCC